LLLIEFRRKGMMSPSDSGDGQQHHRGRKSAFECHATHLSTAGGRKQDTKIRSGGWQTKKDVSRWASRIGILSLDRIIV